MADDIHVKIKGLEEFQRKMEQAVLALRGPKIVTAIQTATLLIQRSPRTGNDIALPDDRQMLADLCAPRYEASVAGITIEPKDSSRSGARTIKKRLGRSPDRGEAVILAHWQQGGVFFG